jgi:hypothetical protein
MKTNYKCVAFSLWSSVFKTLSNLEKLVYLYLLASPYSRVIGISKVDIDWICFYFHISKTRLLELIRKYQDKKLLVFSEETSEVYFQNYLVVYAQRGGPPVLKTLRREFVLVENRELLRRCIEENRAFMISRPDYYNKTIDDFLKEAELLLPHERTSRSQTTAGDRNMDNHPKNPEIDQYFADLRAYFDKQAEEEAELLDEADDQDEDDLPF